MSTRPIMAYKLPCLCSCFEIPMLLIILTSPFRISSSCDRIFTFSSKANKSLVHENVVQILGKISVLTFESRKIGTVFGVPMNLQGTTWYYKTIPSEVAEAMKKQEHCSGADDSPTLFNQVTTRFDEISLKFTCRNRAKI